MEVYSHHLTWMNRSKGNRKIETAKHKVKTDGTCVTSWLLNCFYQRQKTCNTLTCLRAGSEFPDQEKAKRGYLHQDRPPSIKGCPRRAPCPAPARPSVPDSTARVPAQPEPTTQPAHQSCASRLMTRIASLPTPTCPQQCQIPALLIYSKVLHRLCVHRLLPKKPIKTQKKPIFTAILVC